jgi:hypothetical protein
MLHFCPWIRQITCRTSVLFFCWWLRLLVWKSVKRTSLIKSLNGNLGRSKRIVSKKLKILIRENIHPLVSPTELASPRLGWMHLTTLCTLSRNSNWEMQHICNLDNDRTWSQPYLGQDLEKKVTIHRGTWLLGHDSWQVSSLIKQIWEGLEKLK